jgi:hypothetical protein
MKTKYQTYLALLLLMSFCGLQSLWADSITPPAKASWRCELAEKTGLVPSYYCECSEDAAKFKLPSTLPVDGSLWYKTAFKTIKNGKGIAFAVPLSSVIGVNNYQFLSNNRLKKGE